MIKIYNTLTRKKEEFRPIEPNKVKMYVCGPTVYNYIHIGNARPICVFDVFRRFLEYMNYNVTLVQNFTDVNDKIIKQAVLEKSTPERIAEKYILEYEVDAKGLNVIKPTVQPKVSDYIDKIIEFIDILIKNEYAYQSNGDVYYRTRKFTSYGKLSGQSLDDLISGARVEINTSKEDPLDFALWKGCNEDEQHWDSPWGCGRPGWHIECSCMARDTLGDTIDIHCGGQDLIFPHHENEIAQSEAANEKIFSNFWMHNGHINVDNKKMSKSFNNFFLTRELAEKFGYEAIRLLMIQTHYRAPMNYSVDLIESCKASLDRLYQCRTTLELALENKHSGCFSNEVEEFLQTSKNSFIAALENDFNTADGLSVIFDLVRFLNVLASKDNTTREEIEAGLSLFNELIDVFGLLYERKEETVPNTVLDLVEQRRIARLEKRFEDADRIREQINNLGYSVKETRQGIEIKKI